VIEKLGVKNGQMLWPMRVALTNEQFSPGTFELIQLMGKELTLKRLQDALDKIR
jgi:glutamyl-tRNA synthetase